MLGVYIYTVYDKYKQLLEILTVVGQVGDRMQAENVIGDHGELAYEKRNKHNGGKLVCGTYYY